MHVTFLIRVLLKFVLFAQVVLCFNAFAAEEDSVKKEAQSSEFDLLEAVLLCG